MTTIALVSKIITNPSAEEILRDAMRSATKVFNGLIWHLREQYKETGKAPISRKNLNRMMKELPRRKEYYSLSVQATRDEVIGAYKTFFTLRKNGDEKARPPGIRKKNTYSNLRYYHGYGFEIRGNTLKVKLGRSRLDGVKEVAVELCGRDDVPYTKVRNVVITYDKNLGLQAHLVVETIDQEPLVDRVVAVDLGETQIISAIFDDGITLLYSGKEIKAIRRYWNKVRRKVTPPQSGRVNHGASKRLNEKKSARSIIALTKSQKILSIGVIRLA